MGLFSRKIKKIIKGLEKKEDKSLKVEEKKIEVKEKNEAKDVQTAIENKKSTSKILIKPTIYKFFKIKLTLS